MNIITKNLFENEHILEEHWDIGKEKLPMLLDRIAERKQGFYNFFHEESFHAEKEKIIQFTEEKKDTYNDIVLCGIGGSALGPLVLDQALFQNSEKKLHVLENIDPDFIAQTVAKIDLEKTLFIIISKSGGTAETLSQYLFFSELLEKNNFEKADHIVMITGPDGFLREEVEKHGYESFSVPENIGGRFSVLTPVGLLPSALMGINIDELIGGAKSMAECFLSKTSEKNLPFQFALSCYLADEPIHVFMPYSSRLRNLGFWYAQLLAESTGKSESGYTLLPALGATDQHSQLQLFAEGPKDKLVIFLKVNECANVLPISTKKLSSENTKLFNNLSFQELLQTEMDGTRSSLQEKKVANCTLEIESITPKTIGELFMLMQGSTAFLGEMLGINAFDQPGVERSKNITKELLRAKQS